MIEMEEAIREGLIASSDGAPPDSLPYKVWWIAQIPGPSFEVLCSSVAEATQLMDVLAYYDLHQLRHKIKPDYCNMGGMRQWRYWEEDDSWEWSDVEDEEW